MMPPHPDLSQLLETAANGELTPTEHARLEALLMEDPASRRAWLETMRLEAMLHEEFPMKADFAFPSTLPAFTAPPPLAISTWKQRLIPAVAIAACLVVSFLVWRDMTLWENVSGTENALSEPAKESRASQTSLPVATITNLGEGGITTFNVGQRISTGPLVLSKGRMLLTFDCGALVTLEGPVRLDVESDYRGFLHYGTLIARVPPQAQGFLILTPSSTIRDLGTEFALTVGESEGSPTDLHVLEGAVEASPLTGAGSTRRVEELKALRISDAAMEDIKYSGVFFAKLKGPTPPATIPPYTHWTFDPPPAGVVSSNGQTSSLKLMRVKSAVPWSEDRAVKSPFEQGLSFDGKGEFAVTTHPGIGGSEPRTVAFWLRVPRHRTVDDDAGGLPNGIVAWGEPLTSRKWQISWNANPANGAIGAIRQEFGQGYVVGSTDLRDEQWHHVAVVFHGGDEADVATHVKIYIDGRLDTMTGRQQQAIRTSSGGANAEPVTFGRYLGIWENHPPFYLEGALDEVFVLEGAIDQAQVMQLMKQNRLE